MSYLDVIQSDFLEPVACQNDSSEGKWSSADSNRVLIAVPECVPWLVLVCEEGRYVPGLV